MSNLHHPEDLRYSQDHEWVRLQPNGEAMIGISDYAQDELGDIVYIDLPWEGTSTLAFMSKFGDVESVKAASELLSPLSGEVVRVNETLKDKPELVNTDPYGDGWMLVVKIDPGFDMSKLMSAQEYEVFLLGGSH